MSDPKRGTLIAVGGAKLVNGKVTKTVRLTINLDESNESKYPELNYKELVIEEERKNRVVNGKPAGLDPYSENDEDVERVARKFEQKYGGKSLYGRRGKAKRDDFADIGAGYDENDSFIDNTDGYDEMIPPECDTLYGGFYINCGSLEFKTVPEKLSHASDGDHCPHKRNKRRISSSSSEEESSDSSSGSESIEEKPAKAVANGTASPHPKEHRKKKNKTVEKPKKKAKKVSRTDSSAATSGKQTSDDNGHADAESADSRTSQSDSLASKPVQSSENQLTSDSSRDNEAKADAQKLPASVSHILGELETIAKDSSSYPKEMEGKYNRTLVRLETTMAEGAFDSKTVREVWSKAAKHLNVPCAKLVAKAKSLTDRSANHISESDKAAAPANAATPAASTAESAAPATVDGAPNTNKRKHEEIQQEDFSLLTEVEREERIVDALQKLNALIEEKKPGMISTYNSECERVKEERRKVQLAGGDSVERRLPRRRFPWCMRSRALVTRVAALAGSAASATLTSRALPLFPCGFVRKPTLLRQAGICKEQKQADLKRHKTDTEHHTQVVSAIHSLSEPIVFPSSLTVTTAVKNFNDKESNIDKPKNIGLANTLGFSKDILIEKTDGRKDDFTQNMAINSITITPVPNNLNKVDKKQPKEPLLRVKSPAVLNEMAKKDNHKTEKFKEKHKKTDLNTPLHVDTAFVSKDKQKSDDSNQKHIDQLKASENNIPRPGLVPVHHSPTFAKPDRRPPEVRKKKDILIVSDMDPLSESHQETLAVDDSDSDVEFVDDFKVSKGKDGVPSKESSDKGCDRGDDRVCDDHVDDAAESEIDNVMKNLREMEHLQESTKYNSSANAELTSSNKTGGCKDDTCPK